MKRIQIIGLVIIVIAGIIPGLLPIEDSTSWLNWIPAFLCVIGIFMVLSEWMKPKSKD